MGRRAEAVEKACREMTNQLQRWIESSGTGGFSAPRTPRVFKECFLPEFERTYVERWNGLQWERVPDGSSWSDLAGSGACDRSCVIHTAHAHVHERFRRGGRDLSGFPDEVQRLLSRQGRFELRVCFAVTSDGVSDPWYVWFEAIPESGRGESDAEYAAEAPPTEAVAAVCQNGDVKHVPIGGGRCKKYVCRGGTWVYVGIVDCPVH